MAKRIVTKIGDVFCVEVEGRYKQFFQYIANDMTQLNSSTIRVFQKEYPMEYKPVVDEIVKDEVMFYAHTVLRFGIQEGVWYKVGKSADLGLDGLNKILFGTPLPSKYGNEDVMMGIGYLGNWVVWKVNKPWLRIGELKEKDAHLVEYGAVTSYLGIYERIKLGYYISRMPEYEILNRKPKADVDSYVKLDCDGYVRNSHFRGSDAVQEVIVDDRGTYYVDKEHPCSGKYKLTRTKLFEKERKYPEFLTQQEFESMWRVENRES